MKYYTYYSYEEFGSGYIGKGECECNPSNHQYLGSFRDKTFQPTHKIILDVYDNREDALYAECILHDFFDVDKNPHFANLAKQTSHKFHFSAFGDKNPTKRKEVREKIKKNHPSKKEGYIHPMLGRKHSAETKRKMGESRKGKRHSKDTIQRLRNRVISNETRKRMSESQTGKSLSNKTKQNIRDTLLKKRGVYAIIHNSKLGITDEGYISKLVEKHNLHQGHLSEVISGKRKSHKGWIINPQH